MIRLNGVTRSNSRSRAASRAAWSASAGIANCVTSASSPAGIAPCWSLAARIASVHRPQPLDRVLEVGRQRGEHQRDLVAVGAVLLLGRTDTGTAATSGPVGSASWSASQRRSAPAHSAMTTSLTVSPVRVLDLLDLGRAAGGERPAPVRPRSRPLNGVAGARSSPAPDISAGAVAAERSGRRPAAGRGRHAASAGADAASPWPRRAARSGCVARVDRAAARAASGSRRGRRPRHGGCSGVAALGGEVQHAR